MNNKRLFAALLCTAALMTGCDADKAEESASEKNVTVYTQAVEENEEAVKDDAVIAEEPEMSVDEAITLYHRFQPLLGNYLVSDGADYIPPAEDCLFSLRDAFDEKYEAVEFSYMDVLPECSITAYSNFMPEDAVHPASDYDPVTKLLYDNQDTMNVNPIVLIRKLDTGNRLEEEEDWHSFAHNYQAAHVETAPDTTGEEYVRSTLSTYSEIEKDKLRVGYSADEDLWYAYFVNLSPNQRAYKNLTITAFYFQFDEATGSLAKCGTETYVCTTDTLNRAVYDLFGLETVSSSYGFDSYYRAWSNACYTSEGYFTDSDIDAWMEDVLMPDAHEINAEWMLGLLTKNGAVDYEMSNHAKFTYVDNHYNAMHNYYATNAGHFVTWFECA